MSYSCARSRCLLQSWGQHQPCSVVLQLLPRWDQLLIRQKSISSLLRKKATSCICTVDVTVYIYIYLYMYYIHTTLHLSWLPNKECVKTEANACPDPSAASAQLRGISRSAATWQLSTRMFPNLLHLNTPTQGTLLLPI